MFQLLHLQIKSTVCFTLIHILRGSYAVILALKILHDTNVQSVSNSLSYLNN